MNKKKREQLERIKRLCDRVRILHESDENTRKRELWSSLAGLQNIFVRWIPKKDLPVVPFVVDLDREMWIEVLGFNIEEVYTDPLKYLEFELKKKIFAFENFHDDLPITRTVTLWHGNGFIQSLYGQPQRPPKDGHEPWIGKECVLKDKKSLDSLEIPDFYKSGLAPKIHMMFQEMRKALQNDFSVIFPEWDFGGFGVAMGLRGSENFAIDMIEDPKFVHRLMKLLLDSKIRWSQERARFFGTQIIPLYIHNDDISVPLISPSAYEEYVLPYEIKISEFHGGIDYWHSCGRIDPVVPSIMKIANVEMIHISYATDLERSVESIGDKHIIERVLNPIDDVLAASPEQMESTLIEIKSICSGLQYTVRVDAFQVYTTPEKDLKKIKEWTEICRNVMES